ncbi:MAG: hypothetical protein ACOC6B_00035 [Thermodesulfobacteriota bacterium]
MARRSIFLIGLLIGMAIAAPSIGYSYILPSSQIIEFMVKKYASVHALKMTQLTKVLDLQRPGEMRFGESISLMSPDRYRSEVAGQPGKRIIVHNGSRTLKIVDEEVIYNRENRSFLFHFLMLGQQSSRLLQRLEELGINLDQVSLTRSRGKIAYLIGNRQNRSPQLLVDKDLFVPLALQYGNIAFQASDFTELKRHVWYPRYMLYSHTGANIEDYVQEEYRIKDITINPPLDSSLFDISSIASQFAMTR